MKPFPLANADGPEHDSPVRFDPATNGLSAPYSVAHTSVKAAAAGKAVRP